MTVMQVPSAIEWRWDAPMHFRMLVQPTVATFLGMRDGRTDARLGLPPFLLGLIEVPGTRGSRLRTAFHSIWKLLTMAMLMDAIVQVTYLNSLSVLGVIITGSVLGAIPYALARGLSNRVASGRAASNR
jgi:hypothetical protein